MVRIHRRGGSTKVRKYSVPSVLSTQYSVLSTQYSVLGTPYSVLRTPSAGCPYLLTQGNHVQTHPSVHLSRHVCILRRRCGRVVLATPGNARCRPDVLFGFGNRSGQRSDQAQRSLRERG